VHAPEPRRRPRPARQARACGSASGAYLALLGPADTEHAWHVTLPPGGTFTTVPAAVAVSAGGFEGAVAALTAVRRAIRRRTRTPGGCR